MQKSKCNRRCGARAEAKSYLDYAEPRGGKAREAGLKFKINMEDRRDRWNKWNKCYRWNKKGLPFGGSPYNN